MRKITLHGQKEQSRNRTPDVSWPANLSNKMSVPHDVESGAFTGRGTLTSRNGHL